MSAPPRFYVVESSVIAIGLRGMGSGAPMIEYLILDRAYCQRVVARHGTSAQFRSGPIRGNQSRARARASADREAAALNAEHDAWAAA